MHNQQGGTPIYQSMASMCVQLQVTATHPQLAG
jgi:hypothetical protein